MKQLNSKEKSLMQSLSKTGSEKASKALSDLTKQTVEITTLSLSATAQTKAIHTLKKIGPKAIGILFSIRGDLQGKAILLTSQKASCKLALCIEHSFKEIQKSKSLEKDVLKEMGNILVGAYLTALSDLSKLNVLESPPKFMEGTAKAIIEKTLGSDLANKSTIVLETQLAIKQKKVLENLVVVFPQATTTKLLKAMKKHATH